MVIFPQDHTVLHPRRPTLTKLEIAERSNVLEEVKGQEP
jgi:hypothetical protein